MKTTILLSAFFALSALTAVAQDAKGSQVLVAPSVEKPKEEKKPAITPPKMTNAVLGTPVIYSGYFVELARAERKRALFNLKTPLDPQKDMENVFLNSHPETAQPIVLFRIKF